MSERRTPYTTANKPRQPLPGKTAAASFSPPDTTIVSQDELDALRQRLAALEAAAREVCVWQDGGLAISRDQAIREMGKLIAYPGWYQL